MRQNSTAYHISHHYQEDPTYYRKLSERLEEILQRCRDNWEELVEALRLYTGELRQGQQDHTGLDPQTQLPFLNTLASASGVETAEGKLGLIEVTVDLVELIRGAISEVDFWLKPHSRERLRKRIVQFLDDREIVEFDDQPAVADQLVELAKHHHERLVRGGV